MAEVDASRAPVSTKTARNVLIVLTFVNLFNYIDRFIVPGLAVREHVENRRMKLESLVTAEG